MKIDINRLGHALFFPHPHYLDIGTGEILSKAVLESDALDQRPIQLLPVYTCTPIYQQYLDRMFAENNGLDGEEFEKYPRFEHRSIQYYRELSEIEYAYIDMAYHFLEGLIIYGHSYDDDHYSELDYYQEFEEAYMTDFAIKWCNENGFEWK